MGAGSAVGQHLVDSPKVNAISFTTILLCPVLLIEIISPVTDNYDDVQCINILFILAIVAVNYHAKLYLQKMMCISKVSLYK